MPKKTHTHGIIYILSNPDYKGKLKIGYTTKEDLMKRVNNLSRSTGVPSPFKVEWQMQVDSVQIAEEVIFYLLKDYRVNSDKEFFRIPLKTAVKVCKHVSEVIFKSKVVKPKFSAKDWEQISSKLPHAFMKKVITLCLKEGRVGEPLRKRFGSIRYNYKGFNLISIYLRKDYLCIYTHVEKPQGQRLIKKIFPEPSVGKINLHEWEGGYSFRVQNNNQFQVLVRWLELGKKTK